MVTPAKLMEIMVQDYGGCQAKGAQSTAEAPNKFIVSSYAIFLIRKTP